MASITRNNRRRRCRSDPRRRHFSRVFAPFLPEKLPTRAESRNLIPGEGGSSFLSLARCCFTAVFADIYCRVRVEGRRRDATTAKAADCGCFLFPLLLSICDFSSLSLRRTIEFELRFAAVPLSRTISWRRRAGGRDCNYRGAQISTDTHLLLLAHMADVGAAAAIALIALQSSRW